MTTPQLLGILRTLVERAQRHALCDDCGKPLEGWEAGSHETEDGEVIPNHECQVDERAREIIRRTYDSLTGGNKEKNRARGYATR